VSHADTVSIEYTASAILTEHGWTLRVEGIGVTSVRSLDRAERQVRDMIETATGVTTSDAVIIRIVPE
jgi:ribosomal protein S3AE